MKKRFSMSLSTEMFFVSLCALVLSVILYFILSFAGNMLLDHFFGSDEYYMQQDQKLLASLTDYISENSVDSDDWYMLNKWVDENDVLLLSIYKDAVLVYDSEEPVNYSSVAQDDSGVVTESIYEKQSAYQIEFADDYADVVLYGLYSTNYYEFAYLVEFIIPCLFFIAVIMLAVRRKMRYVILLSEEVNRMTNGDLDNAISVRGHDELALLAGGVDSLRLSFIQKLAHITQLQEESRALVTEMSHDLRTPMTPLMIYLGMLREKRWESEEELENYIEKSYEKAAQLRHMSDNMFSYFLMDKNADVLLETITMSEVFYDQLSNMKGYLQLEGYTIQINMDIEDVSIAVSTEFIMRIFDNLISNILKYADRSSAVIINLFCENQKVILHVSNRINELADYSTSTGFGVKNIKKMMKQMSSECIIHQKGDRYDTFLLFRAISAE